MKTFRILFLNLGFWVLYALLSLTFLLFLFYIEANGRLVNSRSLGNIILYLGIIPGILSYIFYYVALYRLYLKKTKTIKLILLSLFITSAICFLSIFLFEIQPQSTYSSQRFRGETLSQFIFIFFISSVVGSIAFIIRAFIAWFDDQNIKKELQERNHEMELTLVKAQLDPHFLFNTLNNIDVLIELEPKKASTYLNKLSDIMRFMLFETKSDKIELSQEIEYLEKFVDLQKIRSATKDFVQLKIEGKGNPKITPMVFIPFVENAFKHVGNTSEKSAIRIELIYTENEINFSCQNSFTNDEDISIESHKIGHELIEKRIQLNYSEQHTLNITTENNMYTVTLLLNLNEN